MRTIDADALMNELIRLGYAYSNDEQRAVFLTIVLVDGGYPVDESIRKTVVILYAVGVVSALLAVFVPSSTTVTAMVAANNITPETVEAVGQTVTEAAEAITQVIVQTIKEVQ